MSKRDDLMKNVGHVRESMGAFAAPDTTPSGPRTLPPHLVGVTRSRDVSLVALDRISPDTQQPREEFDEESLHRLAESLRSRGQLQPIRVRWDEGRGQYVILCGERRWRAAQLACLPTLACVIHEGPLTDGERLAIQLVENCVREDLRPIEQARAYQALMQAQGWSARQLARELAIHHAQIVRALSLLELPDQIQTQVEQGGVAPATAVELAKLQDPVAQAELAAQVVEKGLTRAEVAEAVRSRKAGTVRRAPTHPSPVEFVVAEGIIVTIRYRQESRTTPVQALQLALKQARAHPAKPRADDQAA